MRTVRFYFDPISPYAWLASQELHRLERAGFQLDCQPILFAALLNAQGQKGPAEIPAKRRYVFTDVWRLATQKGLTIEGPPSHPFNPLRALRLCQAVSDPRARQRLSVAILDAPWRLGLDLNDPNTLSRIATGCALDGPALLALTDTPQVKAQLLEATQQAINQGVFGVPSFVVNDQLYWGADRIDSLIWESQYGFIDEKRLERMLARPASAQRQPG